MLVTGFVFRRALSLTGTGLVGTLPNTLTALDSLTNLDLGANPLLAGSAQPISGLTALT